MKTKIKKMNQDNFIDVIRSTYTKPLESFFRELTSNAIMESKSAGDLAQVHIEIPTKDSDWLRISDNGVGMSREKINEIYLNGGVYGLGALSPLSYRDEFVVESFNGEEHSKVVIKYDSDLIRIIDLPITNKKEKGTTISVKIKNEEEYDEIISLLKENILLYKFDVNITTNIEIEVSDTYTQLGSVLYKGLEFPVLLKDGLYSKEYIPRELILSIERGRNVGVSCLGWNVKKDKKLNPVVIDVPSDFLPFAKKRNYLTENKDLFEFFSEIEVEVFSLIRNDISSILEDTTLEERNKALKSFTLKERELLGFKGDNILNKENSPLKLVFGMSSIKSPSYRAYLSDDTLIETFKLNEICSILEKSDSVISYGVLDKGICVKKEIVITEFPKNLNNTELKKAKRKLLSKISSIKKHFDVQYESNVSLIAVENTEDSLPKTKTENRYTIKYKEAISLS